MVFIITFAMIRKSQNMPKTYESYIISRQEAIEKVNTWARKKKPFLWISSFDQKEHLVLDKQQAEKAQVFFKIGRHRNYSSPKKKTLAPYSFQKRPINQEEYARSYQIVKDNLDYGNTYLVNLTKATKVETDLSLEQIFMHANAPYKLWIKDKLVVFSPEIFVKTQKGKISSFPMKGTIDAGIPHAEEIILNDKKEIAEHNTIVDLIRNDLSMISKNVKVKRFRYIDEVKTNQKTLLQVSSEIEGEISGDFFHHLGHHLSKLLPAGSISGAPKKRTLEIIQEAEQYERGFYTGTMAYFDGEELDSAVMIRYIEKVKNQLWFKSGGGITTFSQCEKEYKELIDKVYLPFGWKDG